MNTTAKLITNFVKQVKAQLTGDQNEIVALKNARKADSAVNGQLAALKSKLVDLEGVVEDKQEALHLAKFPKELITSNGDFISRIKCAQENLDGANEELTEVLESIEYFDNLSTEYSEEA